MQILHIGRDAMTTADAAGVLVESRMPSAAHRSPHAEAGEDYSVHPDAARIHRPAGAWELLLEMTAAGGFTDARRAPRTTNASGRDQWIVAGSDTYCVHSLLTAAPSRNGSSATRSIAASQDSRIGPTIRAWSRTLFPYALAPPDSSSR